ncbi:TIGR01906 family membrane protein [Citricoccus nitrophenolicus]|uniref:Integral membrane protein (TIGR01906 family) n=1 Tax=Citricoccus muralis TaxID=169134 RepID=A0A3D9L8E7_9MICC|nr:TIGR01906 family membrane protein [Citricoccus muralis]REE02362.1 integral membrane protein (TIGR01906 family) [Citricoccus muralis]
MAGKDRSQDGTNASSGMNGERDGRTAEHTDTPEFESGLDYAAFMEDEEGNTSDPTAEADPATAPVTSDALDSGDGGSHRADPGTQPTESIDRAEHRADPGTQSTQSIDRAELDAWAAGDAAAQDRPAARARGERGELPPETVTATATPEPDPESGRSGTGTLWDDGAAGSTAFGAGVAGAGVAAGTPVTAPQTAQDDYRGFSSGAHAADAEDRRRDLRGAEARAAARDEALEGPSTGPKVLQVLLAIFFPIVVLIAAVRAVASPLFLWIEYHRPGFPADELGFTTEDRLTYGSAGMDFLFNAAPPRYLSDLTHQGNQLFTDTEVSHMADVKLVMLISMAVGAVLGLLCIIFMIVLARTAKGGIRRSLFAGSLWMLVVLIALAVLAVLGWEQFFATFHSLFFADGTWTFQATDALIRLYPNQFWMDAGIGIAALVLVTLIVTLICTWPTRRRRHESRLAQMDLIQRRNDWYDAQEA